MQDFLITELPSELPRFLETVASGESVRLLDGDREIATVQPTDPAVAQAVDRSPGWIMRLREKYDFEQYGFTKEEVDSWRDRSPGREPPCFE